MANLHRSRCHSLLLFFNPEDCSYLSNFPNILCSFLASELSSGGLCGVCVYPGFGTHFRAQIARLPDTRICLLAVLVYEFGDVGAAGNGL